MTIKVTQITDTHLSVDHPSRSDDLRNCIDAINRRDAPDLVFHTGDVTHNGRIDEYAQAADLLASLPCPVYAIPGNKDNRQHFKQTFAATGYLQLSDPFIQYRVETPRHHMVFLDTLCETSNKGELCSARLTQLKTLLDESSQPADGKGIIIVMHHSPFEVDEIPDPRQFADWSDVAAFGKVISQYPKIERIICGHVHRNIESAFHTTAGGRNIPIHVLTCAAGDLRKGKVSDAERKQPVFREFLLGD